MERMLSQMYNDLTPEKDTRNLIDEYKGLPNEVVKLKLAEKAFPYHIAIENYQHDFNIGTIVRNANAFNAGGVHIVGKRQWNKRGAMATNLYLSVHNHPTVDEFQKWAVVSGLEIIGIDNIKGSVNLGETQLPKNCILVFGQEGPGLSAEMQAICSKIVAIEQFGSTRSVNVGVASGIILYYWVATNILDTSNKSSL